MTDLSDYLENKLLDHLTGRLAYTKPTSVFMALFTVPPGEAGAGTEATGAGYARKAVTWGAAAAGVIANSAAVSFTPTGGNYGTISGIAVFDAVTGGNMLFYKDIADFATYADVTVQFAIGALTVKLD